MTFFAITFYISLAIAIVVLMASKDSKDKALGAGQKEEVKSGPWFIVNVESMVRFGKELFDNKIKPHIIKISLMGLKTLQNQLQSVRRWLRRVIIRLTAIDEKHRSGNQKFASQ